MQKQLIKIFALHLLLGQMPVAAGIEEKTFSPDKLTHEQIKFRTDYTVRFRAAAKKELQGQKISNVNDVIEQLVIHKDLHFKGKYEEGQKVILDLLKKYPDVPLVLSHASDNFYTMSTLLDEKLKDQRINMLEKGIEFAEKCVKIAPESGTCWLSWVALHGRIATIRGVFAQLFAIGSLHNGMMNAYKHAKANPFPSGTRSSSFDFACFALEEFYRVVPDSFLFWVVTGYRGNSKTSYEYAAQMERNTVIDAVAIGKASLCYGSKIKDDKMIAEGAAALRLGLSFPLFSKGEESEYRRLRQAHLAFEALANKNDYYAIEKIGCTDYGNDDKEAAKKLESQKNK